MNFRQTLILLATHLLAFSVLAQTSNPLSDEEYLKKNSQLRGRNTGIRTKKEPQPIPEAKLAQSNLKCSDPNFVQTYSVLKFAEKAPPGTPIHSIFALALPVEKLQEILAPLGKDAGYLASRVADWRNAIKITHDKSLIVGNAILNSVRKMEQEFGPRWAESDRYIKETEGKGPRYIYLSEDEGHGKQWWKNQQNIDRFYEYMNSEMREGLESYDRQNGRPVREFKGLGPTSTQFDTLDYLTEAVEPINPAGKKAGSVLDQRPIVKSADGNTRAMYSLENTMVGIKRRIEPELVDIDSKGQPKRVGGAPAMLEYLEEMLARTGFLKYQTPSVDRFHQRNYGSLDHWKRFAAESLEGTLRAKGIIGYGPNQITMPDLLGLSNEKLGLSAQQLQGLSEAEVVQLRNKNYEAFFPDSERQVSAQLENSPAKPGAVKPDPKALALSHSQQQTTPAQSTAAGAAAPKPDAAKTSTAVASETPPAAESSRFGGGPTTKMVGVGLGVGIGVAIGVGPEMLNRARVERDLSRCAEQLKIPKEKLASAIDFTSWVSAGATQTDCSQISLKQNAARLFQDSKGGLDPQSCKLLENDLSRIEHKVANQAQVKTEISCDSDNVPVNLFNSEVSGRFIWHNGQSYPFFEVESKEGVKIPMKMQFPIGYNGGQDFDPQGISCFRKKGDDWGPDENCKSTIRDTLTSGKGFTTSIVETRQRLFDSKRSCDLQILPDYYRSLFCAFTEKSLNLREIASAYQDKCGSQRGSAKTIQRSREDISVKPESARP